MATVATLCYVLKDGRILLIKKKKGLGAGKWNGPGGKVNVGEDVADAAVREVKEETGLAPLDVEKIGYHEFYTGEKLDWIVHVFVAGEFEGEEKETDEAAPKWFSVDDIPYDEMWPDDRIWMPVMLAGKRFKAKFYYDSSLKNILRHDIEIIDEIDAGRDL